MPDNWRKHALPVIEEPPDLYWYRVTVAKAWYDADTVRVDFDYGMEIVQRNVPLRLHRIDAFAKKSKKGQEGADFCNTLLPVGKEFYMQTVKDDTEKYGRYLAEVYIRVDDVGPLMNLNDILVKQGLALYWDGQGSHPTGEKVNG